MAVQSLTLYAIIHCCTNNYSALGVVVSSYIVVSSPGTDARVDERVDGQADVRTDDGWLDGQPDISSARW